jgi:outer membrane protein OmpA-like peptidoglycan-associated protein
MCEKKDKIEAATVIVDEEYASNKDYKLEEKVAHEKVYFTNLSVELNPLALAAINEIVSLMQNNPDLVIEIHAHVDPSEAALATKNDQAKDLAKRRGEAVIKQIEKAGIASNRLMLVVDEDKSPVGTGDTESDKAKNRRVEFKMR